MRCVIIALVERKLHMRDVCVLQNRVRVACARTELRLC